MKHFRLCTSVVFSIALVASGFAQSPTSVAEPGTASVDAIIGALYTANSVMVDEKKNADRFRMLFAPDARLMPTATAPNGKVLLRTQTVDEYIKGAMAGPPRGGFYEREIARTSEAYGPIVQVFSTYESRRNTADTTRVRGINSIQLYNDGVRWWVVSVLWANERNNGSIPATYMKLPAKTP